MSSLHTARLLRAPTIDGSIRARRFATCNDAQHINAVRASWQRPSGHEFFGFWIGESCGLRLFRVWKNGGSTMGARSYVPLNGLDVTDAILGKLHLLRGSNASASNATTNLRSTTTSDDDNNNAATWSPCKSIRYYSDEDPHATSVLRNESAARRFRSLVRHIVSRSKYFTSIAILREPTDHFLSGFAELYTRTRGFQAGMSTAANALLPAGEIPGIRDRRHATPLEWLRYTVEELLAADANATRLPADSSSNRTSSGVLSGATSDTQLPGVLPGNVWGRNFHVAPQVAFLLDAAGRPRRYDYFGEVSRLEEELIFLLGPHEGQHDRAEGSDNETAASPRPSPSRANANASSSRARLLPVLRPERHPSLGTTHTAGRVTLEELGEHPRLHRKICVLLMADYCCLGYEFPAPCADLRCG